jgi:uncharacterized protein YndB with AHSA1/START domain
MTVRATLHAALVFERNIPAPIDRVFKAFADPLARSEWGALGSFPLRREGLI